MVARKRTISLPEDVSDKLDETIPNQERSKFIAETLSEALEKRSRKKLIDAINNVDQWQPQEKSVVDIVREIRDRHTQELDNNTDTNEK